MGKWLYSTFSLRRFLIFIILVVMLSNGKIGLLSTWSDCKADYEASVTLLDDQVQQAEQKKLYDADAFETTFQKSVNKLQNGHCLPELLSLIQHIQTAQKKYPIHPAQQTKAAPIED